MNWFRWYHGSVSDNKWPLIARRSGRSVGEVVAVWGALLEYASQNEERGGVKGFNCEEFDVLFGFEDGVCASIYAAMCQRGVVKDGVICAWGKRQVKDESATERKQLQREREKLKALRADLEARLARIEAVSDFVCPSEGMSRDCPAPSQGVTKCHLEQNREEQRRTEKEIQTDAHSAAQATTETLSISSAQAEELPKEDGKSRAKRRQKHDYSGDFEQFWFEYPNTKGKERAWRCWQALIRARASPAMLTTAARGYASECRELCREVRYVMHGATFLGPDERWRDYVPEVFVSAAGGSSSGGVVVVREEDFMLEGGGVDAKAFERARRTAAARRVGGVPPKSPVVG